MGKGDGGKGQKLYDYYGSIAGVVCAGPVDELVALVVDNKMVWPGGSDWASGVDEIRSVNVRRSGGYAYVRFENPHKLASGDAFTIAGFSTTSLNYVGTVSDGIDAYEIKYPSAGGDISLVDNTEGLLTKKVAVTTGSVQRFRGRAYTALSNHDSTPTTRPPNATYWTPYSVLRSAQADDDDPYAFTVEGFGNAYLYWGTATQNLDATGEAILTEYGHPPYRRQCVVVLKDFLFGRERTTAPNVEVIVRRVPNQSLVTGSPADPDSESQVNPASIAAEWVSDPVFGLGQSVLDSTTANAIAAELEGSSDLTYISPVLDKAQPVRALLSDLSEYFDGWFRWSGESIEVGRFIHDDTPATFDDSNTIDQHDMTDEPSWDVAGWSDTSNVGVVKFRDRERAFKDGGARASSSFNRKVTGTDRSSTLDRPWITRRQQATDHASEWVKVNSELYAGGTVRVRSEKASTIEPGDSFRITNSAAGVSIDARCIEKVTLAPPSGHVQLKFISERAVGRRVQQSAPVIGGGSSAPLAECILRWAVMQLPPTITGDTIHQITVLGARTNRMTTGFRVWLQQADVTEFFALGDVRSFAVYGTLAQAYADSYGSGDPPEDDTETLQLSLDAQTVAADLARISSEQTADAIEYGNLLVWVIGSSVDEIMTLKAIRADAGVYKLKVRRARFGKSKQSFSTGDRAFIFFRDGLSVFTNDKWPDYTSGTAYSATFRFQSFNALGEADLTEETVCPDHSNPLTFEELAGGSALTYTTTIGDGTTKIFDILHGLNSLKVSVQVVAAGGSKQTVYPSVLVTSVSTVRLKFPIAPTSGQWRVKVTS